MSVRERTLPRGWYPGTGRHVRGRSSPFLRTGRRLPRHRAPDAEGLSPRGVVFLREACREGVPHVDVEQKADVVVLYGGHLGPNDSPKIVLEDRCETPLGDIEMDRAFAEKLMKRVNAKKEPPSSGDNTVEVQLAMIKYFFPEAKVVAVRSPMSLAAAELGKEVAALAREVGVSIVAIGSTDLTHYGPNYGFVPRGLGVPSVEWVKKENDKGFIEEALRMNTEGLLRHAVENNSAAVRVR